MSVFFTFLIIYWLFSFSFEYEPIICNAQRNISLNYGDIIFIESPNFPAAMTEMDKRNCVINVEINDKNASEIDLVFIVTNGYLNFIDISHDNETLYSGFIDTRLHVHFLYTNKTKIIIKFTNFTSKSWNAFQGYVTYDYKEQKCPFSHLSSPFIFQNESQIMYIRSRYRHFCHTEHEQDCTWRFHGIKGYGFKFLLLEFDIENTDLRVSNSSNYIITDGHYTKSNQVFYNSDYYLNIRYIGTCNNSLYQYLFEAEISLVKNEWNEIITDCNLISNNETTTTTYVWTNINGNEVGYPKNSKCETTFNLTSKMQLIATVTKLRIETYVDELKFVELYPPFFRRRSVILDSYSHVFQLPENLNLTTCVLPKCSPSVTWMFESDGSVQSKGFEVYFETIECKCAPENIIAPCHDSIEYSIMNDPSHRVCGHLKCNFTIIENPKCPNKNLVIGIYRPLRCAYTIEFNLFSNNKIFLNSSNFRMNAKVKFALPHGKKNILSFISKNVTDETIFFFRIAAVETVFHKNILLTTENPTYAVEFATLPENTILTVELNEDLLSSQIKQKDALEMYANCENSELLTNCLIYDNKNMTKILSNIEDLYYGDYSKYARAYTSPETSITIYKPLNATNDYSVVLIRAVNAHTVNCLFKKTIFDIGTMRFDGQDNLISMASGNDGPCELVLLSQPLSQKGLKKFWSNLFTQKNIILYDGIETRNKVLELNKNNMHLWENIILGSIFYTIVIPPKTNLIITPYDVYNSPPCTITNKPFQSFIDTPYFGISSTHTHNERQIGFYIIENTNVTFEIGPISLSENGSLWLIDSIYNQSISLTEAYPKASFTKTNVSIFYYEPSINFKGARIYITNIPKIN